MQEKKIRTSTSDEGIEKNGAKHQMGGSVRSATHEVRDLYKVPKIEC